jgi:hypothetical protein
MMSINCPAIRMSEVKSIGNFYHGNVYISPMKDIILEYLNNLSEKLIL